MGRWYGFNPWTFIPEGRITGICIANGVVIDSIRFTYKDYNHVSHHSDTFGGDGGTNHTVSSTYYIIINVWILSSYFYHKPFMCMVNVFGYQFNLEGNEDIIRVSGTTGEIYSITVITSLSFHTNKGKTYGPYGTDGGTIFSLPVTKGKLIGFFGDYGDFLDSFGVILKP